ncbi:hypothetical protein [Bacteriovorax sp. DB6_IX]|uniref:hypothetical protein n=1 Tax=Bacteriovorax sp. DB6_IX TaxID=1353530 RepID=UPI0005509325|nr:hypothetical protein [Bacteriovorax sp. DB6_IX]
MRRSFKSINLIKLVLLIALSYTVFAKAPKAVVNSVKGNVFVTSHGQTKKLDLGDYIYDFDQIFTEVGAQVSFNDYYDHTYHLSGSAHATILNKMIELRSGYLWTQSHENSENHFHVQTVNATVSYTHGEFVVSYDSESGKTQLLSIKGTHLFKNNNHEFLKEEISAGKFSFIIENYENGAPRVPTPIGSNAYTAVLSLFDDIRPMQKSKSAVEEIEKFPSRPMEKAAKGRMVASVESKDKATGGSLIILREKKEDRSKRDDSLLNFYKSKVTTLAKKYKKKPYKFKPEYNKKSNAVVKVYGVKKQRVPASKKVTIYKAKAESARKPASMVELNPQVKVKTNAFETSLMKEYKKQMRHSNEINSLIKELKSYDQDYNEAY